jgi:uncharacterized protein Usg
MLGGCPLTLSINSGNSMQVTHCKLIKPDELKAINGEFRLH